MKNIFSFLLSIIVAFASMFMSFAHSGRTDASGGHRDNKNKSGLGLYHYHCGGTPAHLHTNGVCPYKTGSTTKNNSPATKSNSGSTTSTTKSSSSTSSKQILKIIVTAEKTAIHEKASINSLKLATAKKGYTFTPTGSTKSFWEFEFKKKDDNRVYIGYILKADTKEK